MSFDQICSTQLAFLFNLDTCKLGTKARPISPITRTESIRSMCCQFHSRFTPDSFCIMEFILFTLTSDFRFTSGFLGSLFRLTSDSCRYTDLQSFHNYCFSLQSQESSGISVQTFEVQSYPYKSKNDHKRFLGRFRSSDSDTRLQSHGQKHKPVAEVSWYMKACCFGCLVLNLFGVALMFPRLMNSKPVMKKLKRPAKSKAKPKLPQRFDCNQTEHCSFLSVEKWLICPS